VCHPGQTFHVDERSASAAAAPCRRSRIWRPRLRTMATHEDAITRCIKYYFLPDPRIARIATKSIVFVAFIAVARMAYRAFPRMAVRGVTAYGSARGFFTRVPLAGSLGAPCTRHVKPTHTLSIACVDWWPVAFRRSRRERCRRDSGQVVTSSTPQRPCSSDSIRPLCWAGFAKAGSTGNPFERRLRRSFHATG